MQEHKTNINDLYKNTLSEVLDYLPPKEIIRARSVSHFWKATINELVLPAQITREFSSGVVAQAISMTKNIIRKDQWNSIPLDLVYYICRCLYKEGREAASFENVCNRLLSLPRYNELARNALTRYKEYFRAFRRFEKSYNKKEGKIPFGEAFATFANNDYKIAYFRHKSACDICNIQALIEVISDPNSVLTSLDLFEDNIEDLGAQALAEALKSPDCKLTSLDLYQNGIGDLGTQKLTEALTNPNCKLTSLRLCLNLIGDLSAQTLAEALKSPNCKLTSLDLGLNDIGDLGAQKLAEALTNPNCKLTSLNLVHNNIGVLGTQKLAEALTNPDCKLTSLNLYYNNIGVLGAQKLAEALKNPNCKLTSLSISVNIISDLDVQALAEALKDPNCKLTSFYLGSPNIGDSGVKALAEAKIFLNHHGRHIEIIGFLDCWKMYLKQAEEDYNACAKSRCEIAHPVR